MNREATEAGLASIEHLPALSPDLKRALREARIAIESVYLSDVDKEDLADSLQRFARELANPQRHPERLKRYWGRIYDLAPTVGHLLSTSEAIQEASLWWGDHIQPKGGFLNEGPAREYVEAIDDPQIRLALEWAYAVICEMSYMDGVRPEGPFDLLYFYKLLAGLLRPPYFEVKMPVPRPTED